MQIIRANTSCRLQSHDKLGLESNKFAGCSRRKSFPFFAKKICQEFTNVTEELLSRKIFRVGRIIEFRGSADAVRRIDQMLRPIESRVLIFVVERYLLRRGCATKSRDTASTCSWLAWWLLMVLEYISNCVFPDSSVARYPPLSLLTSTNSRGYWLAAA